MPGWMHRRQDRVLGEIGKDRFDGSGSWGVEGYVLAPALFFLDPDVEAPALERGAGPLGDLGSAGEGLEGPFTESENGSWARITKVCL